MHRPRSAIALLFAFAATLPAQPAPPEIPGSNGAIPIRFTMPEDGTATIALYHPGGRLIRPLAQVVPLTKGFFADFCGKFHWAISSPPRWNRMLIR